MVKESSGSGVKLEQTAKPVATVNGLAYWHHLPKREEKDGFALMVSLEMRMIDVFGYDADAVTKEAVRIAH